MPIELVEDLKNLYGAEFHEEVYEEARQQEREELKR
jgi:hypothetical protein